MFGEGRMFWLVGVVGRTMLLESDLKLSVALTNINGPTVTTTQHVNTSLFQTRDLVLFLTYDESESVGGVIRHF